MDHRKLFNVLVLGGAMLGLGCLEEDPPPPEDAGAAMSDDAGADVDASAGGDAGGLMECGFCPNEACCETDASGTSRTRAGMMCCWGTSC